MFYISYRSPDKKTLQPSPNSKRKILLIQHQQRSSMDTDALDYEDPVTDKVPKYNQISFRVSFEEFKFS